MRGRIEVAFGSALPAPPREAAAFVWQERPLEADYAFVFIDSMPLRIRENGLMCSRNLHFVLGIMPDGSKDILAFHIEDPAARTFWPAAIRNLKARGVTRIGIAIAEDLPAVAEAFRKVFPDTNVIANVKLALRRPLEPLVLAERAAIAKEVIGYFAGDNAEGDCFALPCVRRHPDLAWQTFWHETGGLFQLPSALRKFVSGTTAVESVVEKLRRRGLSKRGSFASREAASRELVLVLQDAKGAWRVAPNLWQSVRNQIFLAK